MLLYLFLADDGARDVVKRLLGDYWYNGGSGGRMHLDHVAVNYLVSETPATEL